MSNSATLVFLASIALMMSVLFAFFPASTRHHVSVKRKSRLSKGEVDGLVRERGVKPVRPHQSAKTKRKIKGNASKKISIQKQLDYARNGHVVLRNFLNPSLLRKIRSDLEGYVPQQELNAWRQKVEVASNYSSTCKTVKECRRELDRLGVDSSSLPFLQHFNTWKKIPTVFRLAQQLGRSASVLMDVYSVRLYQDTLFCKRTQDGPTPWHVDAKMSPFDTSHFLTFWIPLQRIHETGLLFVSKSHSDFALPYWNGHDGAEYFHLENRYNQRTSHYMPLELGDVTVHSGWTLHCADGHSSGQERDRWALAISFVDANAQVRENLELGDNEDYWSYKDWYPDVPKRTLFRHVSVPVVWPVQDQI